MTQVGNALYLLEHQFSMPHVLDAADIACENPDEKAGRLCCVRVI